MNVKTHLSLTMHATATKAGDLTSTAPNAVIAAQYIQRMINGTGLDQADVVYADSNTVASGAFVTYALDATVKDVFGDNVVLARVKGFYVKNTSTTAAVLLVGGGSDGAGTNAWDTWVTQAAADGSEQILVPKGGFIFMWAPDAVAWTVGAGDLFAIEGSVDAGAFDLVIIGSSA